MAALQPRDFHSPAILFGGPVDYAMYNNFRSQLDGTKKEGLVVTEVSTLGGDPEVARMMERTFNSIAKTPRIVGLCSWERPPFIPLELHS